MNRPLLSLVCVMALFAACKSSDETTPSSAAGAPSDAGRASSDGGESAAAGGKSEPSGNEAGNASTPEDGGAASGGGVSAGGASPGAAGNESVGGSDDMTPACVIPATVVGSCAKKDLMGNIKSCAVYWGSAFTADALKAACPSEPTLGENICPSAGSVGACEWSSGPTALANYYYNAADGTPANQAQCNASTGHVWCAP